MSKVMLINAAQPEEIRVAVLDGDSLGAFYVERKGKVQAAGNIYKARVVNIEPSLQAAFVDLGSERNGFLHASDVIHPDGGHREILNGNGPADAPDNGVSRRSGRHVPIGQMLTRGQEVLVQISKEALGGKGATLTTYISLPGRFLVLMPGLARLGVSRKIEDEDQRRRLKQMLAGLHPPAGMGVILRTASLDATEDDLQRDLNNLLQLWRAIRSRASERTAPAALYLEGDLVVRAIRDTLTPDMREIVIDDEESYNKVRSFLQAVNPDNEIQCRKYIGAMPLFHKYGVEEMLEHLFDRRVELENGISIIIEQTEAMVAIDVNSGRFRKRRSNAETILHVNLEAAREIARQVRLRDIGGLVLIDFIDMESPAHRQRVEQALDEAMAEDKARRNLLPISPLGVLEMTRQRIRPSLRGALYVICAHCGGGGHVRSRESTGLDFIRTLHAALQTDGVQSILAEMRGDTALYLANQYRRRLAEIEQETGLTVELRANDDVGPSQIRLYTIGPSGKTSLFDG